jgi:transposase-like protein
MPDETDTCGYVKDSDGQPCELPASRDDGRCHHHTGIESERANGGRPSLLDEYREDILDGARQGMTLEGCARLAGIDESTLHRWIDKYDDFRKSLRRARAQGELQHLQSVNDPGSRFVLERSFGYTKTEKREIDADVTHDGDLLAEFE